MIVLIDDERDFIDAPADALIFRNSADTLNWLNSLDETEQIDQLWFDHDLGIVEGEKDSTIPVLRWFEEKCFFGEAPKISQVIVHTSNNVGGKEIFESMKRYYKTVRVFAGDYLIVND